MDEATFWAMIETAWKAAGKEGKAKARKKLADGELSYAKAQALAESLADEVAPALRERLDELSEAELLAFDRILERKLYEVDRAEIQTHTDGSDDGFLYARGFIVGAGEGYFDAVNADPSKALVDLECEAMCYLSWHLHHEKFGDIEPSGISRETCSNAAGWAPPSEAPPPPPSVPESKPLRTARRAAAPVEDAAAAPPKAKGYDPASLPRVATVEVVDLRKIHGWTFGLGERPPRKKAPPSVALPPAAAEEVAALWRRLPPGEQARCHLPAYGLRFRDEETVRCEASLCWECRNIYGKADGTAFEYEFDAEDPVSQDLLAACRAAFGHPAPVE